MEETKTYNLNKIQNLKCGENVHQEASLYNINKRLNYEMLSGNLTYNNILDSSCALDIISEFFDVAGIVVVKHANPASVALANNLGGALEKILDSDPLAPFDSTIALSQAISIDLARKLIELKLKVILAPAFEEGAIEILKKVPNIKIVKINTPLQEIPTIIEEEIKITPFGTLIQSKDKKDLDVETFKVVTSKKPSQEELEDMIFAYKIAKHAKSTCAVVAKGLRTLGICAGQSDYINAIESAISRVCDSPKDSIIAIDGTINIIDNIQIMAQNRLSGLIQAGGSIKDKEIVEYADKYEIAIVSTNIKHIKH